MKRTLLAFSAALLLLVGQGASAARAADVDGEEIRAFNYGFSGAPQGDREAGPYTFVYTNTSRTGHPIIFVRIAPGHVWATDAEIIAAIDKGPAVSLCPSGCFFDAFAGSAFSGPFGTTTGRAILFPGRYAYFCPVREPDGTPHYRIGMFGTFHAK
jgi:hypothetical protein